VLKQARSAVFLTNDFDDPLSGFDTAVYALPATDDLVFHPRSRRARGWYTGGSVQTMTCMATRLFEHFRPAPACAISAPRLCPQPVAGSAAAVDEVFRPGRKHPPSVRELGQSVLTLAECCADFKLPSI
jgi:glucuronate isomerase